MEYELAMCLMFKGSVRTPEDSMAVPLSEARTNEDGGDDSEKDVEEEEGIKNELSSV